ncbi:hypothetical protein IJJ97_01785, partial [bacterium]|nr:hypothetical protein [bacterium]
MKNKLYIFFSLFFLCFMFGILKAEENNSILFLFLIPSENANISIEYVKVFDSSEKEVATFYPADSASSKNSTFLESPNGGHWGNVVDIEGIKCRNINERQSELPYSCFVINLPKSIQNDMYFTVKYFDSEGELIPVGFIKGSEFIRLGQIYRSRSNKWVEDIFEI